MQNLIRIAVIGLLAAIVVSLGSALLHLSRGGRGDETESRKLVRALTVRIALSLALFALVMLAWYWHFVDVVWLGLYIFVYWL